MISKCPFDRGHPIGEVIHRAADLVKKIKEFGEGDGVIGVGLSQDVGAFALAGDH